MPWNDVPAERGLRDHLGVLRRQWWVVLAVLMVALAAAAFGLAGAPTRYQSTVEVSYPQQAVTITNLANDQLIDRKLLDPSRATQNESRFATSDAVRNAVADQLPGVPFSVQARPIKDTDSFLLVATASSPQDAQRLAQATADAYVTARRAAATDTTEATIERQVRAIDELLASTPPGGTNDAVRDTLEQQRAAWIELRSTLATGGMPPVVLRAASTPDAPSSPRPVRSLLFAGVIGLLFGLLAAYAREGLTDRVGDLDELARASRAPVLGTTPAAVSQIRTARLDDPAVRAAHLAVPLDDAGAAASANGLPATVVLVPKGAHGRRVRDALGVLERLDVPVVGTLLAERAVAAEAPSAATTADA